jgi:hypothetical protein
MLRGDPTLNVANRRAVARPLAGFLALALVGLVPVACGPTGPEMASISGKVTYNGKPVPKGTITFIPVVQGGRNAVGVIGPDGSYSIQTEKPGDGALLGDYNVTISAHDEAVLDYIPAKPVEPKLLAPAKYENPKSTDLKATVKRGASPINFDLKD